MIARFDEGLIIDTAVTRERLQTALAGLWLLDGLLQLQPYMFTENFADQTIASTAQGSPGWVGHPVTWAAREIGGHAIAANTLFALIQIALGLGIAHRRTRRVALGCSIVWAGGVWLFGEGLGGLFTGNANPLTGAPGSALLYSITAILIWPVRKCDDRFASAGLLGTRGARSLWTVLWGVLAYLTLLPANRAPGAFVVAMTGGMMSVGEPHWYTGIQDHLARLTIGHDTTIAIVLALVLAVIAVSVWARVSAIVRAGLAAAIVVGLVYWVCGQAFGMPFMGMATDPNSGPLLALIALAFWPTALTESARATLTAPQGVAA